jgi:hypothetical protein
LRIEYQMTRQAVLAASRLQTHPVRFVALLSGAYFTGMLAVTALDGGLACNLACGRPWLGHWLLGAVSFGVVMTAIHWFVLLPFRAWRLHRQNPMLFGDSEFSAVGDGFTIRSPKTTTEVAWGDVQGFKEDRDVFLLMLSRSVGLVVAKAGVAAAELAAMRDLLAGKLRRF